MPTIALHTILRTGCGPVYDDVHQAIPEAVALALREAGVGDWRIWRDGEHVFHLVEVDDLAHMRATLAELPANQEWQATVAPYFEVADSYDGDDPAMAALWSLKSQLGLG